MKSKKPVVDTKTTNNLKLLETNEDNKKEEDKDECEEKSTMRLSVIEKIGNPFVLKKIIIALSVFVIVICVVFAVYQFYCKKSQLKIDLCQQNKIDAYEKKIEELTHNMESMVCENNQLNERIGVLQNDYRQMEETIKKAEYESKPQAVFRTTKKGKKQHHTEPIEDEDDNVEVNEYTVEHPKFDDAPITRQKKKVNPQQALKSHINEGAKKAYDKKQSMIQQQMDNDRDDEEEREQIEIQKQLGLGREINDEKLMELAEEQSRDEINVNIRQNDNLEDVIGIDESLIA